MSELQQKIIDLESCIERRDQIIYDLQDGAKRYRWLKDNGHLDARGVLKIGEWKIINIDHIIDQEIKEQPK
jgi:hypothetical protein